MNYNIHPIFVHFPIALLFVYSLIKIVPVKKFLPKINWKDIEIFTLIIGVLGALVALATGDGAEHLFRVNRQIVEIHSTFAGLATVLYAALLAGEIAYVLNHNFSEKIKSYSFVKKITSLVEKIFCDKTFSFIISVLALIAISITGILGGALVYGASADPVAGIILKMFGITL